ncbi:hybrid sensor histidine kinase/response regulator [Desulfatiferula olefinivorans]
MGVHKNLKYMFEIRVVVFLAGLFYSVFGVLDVLLVPDDFKPLLLIRFGIVLPFIIFVILFSYTRYFGRYMQLVFMATVFVSGGGIIAMIVITPPPATYSYYAGLILVFMFQYTFGRVRFIWATTSGWTLILVYEMAAVLFTSTPVPVLINNNFFFICANLIGMTSCYVLEFFDRRNFFMALQLEEEQEKTNKINEELENRVLERTALLNEMNRNLKVEIGQRKKIEGELRKIKDELEIRVEERTRELINANRALERARDVADASARSKSEFLANMSHEIRTPMNAIIGMSDLAMNSGLSRIQRNEYLDIIRTSARSLLGIINDILDLSKIESGRLELDLHPFNIREHVEGVADMFIQAVHTKGVGLIVDIAPDVPDLVRGDSLRLQQVLLNLISNAMKFTETGEICVKLTPGRQENDTVELCFEVSDTGIGIDLEKTPNLFDAFAQADGTITRKYGGTGLGLTICNRIVTLMGGAISVDSRPGEGSRFQFNVILGRERDVQAVYVPRHQSLHGTRVITVIANPNLSHVVDQMLEGFGLRHRSVSSVAALESLIASSENGAVCDVLMLDEEVLSPEDYERIGEIKTGFRPSGSAAVVLIASLKTRQDRDALTTRGIDAVVMNPVKSSSMLDALMTLVNGQSVKRPRLERIYRKTHAFDGMHVLLVEDNLINQMVAVEILSLEGIHVERASNGLEAIEKLKDQTFDVVLMDVQMPEMDGIEATRIIRGDMALTSDTLPVIAMTAHVMHDDRRRCLDAGMNDFVSKPIERETLFAVLGRFYHSGQDRTPPASLSAPSADQSRPALPGLDVPGGLKRLGCDFETYRSIVAQFAIYLKSNVEQLKYHASRNDGEGVLAEAHSIKGSAANISAFRLEQAARRIEGLSGQGEQDRLFEAIVEVDAAFREFDASQSRLFSEG